MKKYTCVYFNLNLIILDIGVRNKVAHSCEVLQYYYVTL